MIKKISGIFVILFLLFVNIVFASDRLLWPDIKTDLPFDKSLKTGRLSNGFRYVIKHNNTPEKRVAVYLGVMAGSLFEQENQRGLAHFLEHMVFDGSKHFKPGELIKYFQRIGMNFGGDTNAHTGFNETVYKLFLPDGSDKKLDEAFLVMKDFASSATLLPSQVDKERRVILAEKRARDSIRFRTMTKKYSFLFDGLLLPERFPIGKEIIIRNAKSSLLKKFYNSFYSPEREILVVVGDVSPESVEKKVKDFFSDILPKYEKKPFIPSFGELKIKKGLTSFYYYEKEAAKTGISLNLIKPIMDEVDTKEYEERWIKKEISMRLLSLRLHALLEEKDTPYQSSFAFIFPFMKKVSWASISVSSSSEKFEKSLAVLIRQFKQAHKFGFSDLELKRVKNEFLTMFDSAVKKAETRDSLKLASDIVSNAMEGDVYMSPLDKKRIFAPYIKKLTLKEINDTFKEIWHSNNIKIVVTGNLLLKKNAEQYIKKYAEQEFEKPVKKSDNKKKVSFPYLKIPENNSIILKANKYKKLSIESFLLSNNIAVNLKKNTFKKDTIKIKVSFGKGTAFETEKNYGLGYLSSMVVNLSGLNKIGVDRLETIMSDKDISLKFNVGKDRFSFEGSCSKKDTKTFFELLYHYINDPGVKEAAYKLALKRIKSSYEESLKSIDGTVTIKAPLFFAENDKRFGIPTFEELSKYTIYDIKNYIFGAFKNGAMEVSVVGDFNKKDITALVLKYFGALEKRRKIKPLRPETASFPIGQEKTIFVKTRIPSAYILAGIKTDDLYPIKNARILSLGAEILSERLRERIREKLGAAYSPFAYHYASRMFNNYGGLYLGVKTTPQKVKDVKKVILNIIGDVSSKGISKDEFERAKKPLLNSITTSIQKNDYWIGTVLDGSYVNPIQLGWASTIVTAYSSITKKMVEEKFREYFDKKKVSFFIVKSKQVK